jgi:hypothetical protein
VETRAARLKELEDMAAEAAEMLATARKLPPGRERHDIIREIGQIRARIDWLKAKAKTKTWSTRQNAVNGHSQNSVNW